jgi:hypothetical protein
LAAGIGDGIGSYGNGSLTISGGTVNATGGTDGVGIGGSLSSTFETIQISGGAVTAKSTQGSNKPAGIGGAYAGSGNITITGGSVIAIVEEGSAGIGGGPNSSSGTINISGGTIVTNGTGIGIGAQEYRVPTSITGKPVIFTPAINGKTESEPNNGILIGDDVQIDASEEPLKVVVKSDFSIPDTALQIIDKNTKLDITDNKTMTIEAGGTTDLYGTLEIENGSKLVIKGTLNIKAGGKLDIFGEVEIEAGAVINIDENAEVVIEEGGKIVDNSPTGIKEIVINKYEIIGARVDENGIVHADENSTITVKLQAKLNNGETINLAPEEYQLTSSVVDDIIKDNTVTFPHASFSTITATLKNRPWITTAVDVEVELAPVPAPAPAPVPAPAPNATPNAVLNPTASTGINGRELTLVLLMLILGSGITRIRRYTSSIS